jgi:hypothetical protein
MLVQAQDQGQAQLESEFALFLVQGYKYVATAQL